MEFQYTPSEARKFLIDALRSGKYSQTTGRLRDNDNGFCCLGVACDVFRKCEEIGEWKTVAYTVEEKTVYQEQFEIGTQRETFTLPYTVRQWLGFKDSDGDHLDDEEFPTCLSELNDTGKTLVEIASIIESEPKGLLV